MGFSGLLIASPQMVDVFFANTVVLLCDYNAEGALGIVVNRTTELDPDEILEQMKVTDGGGIRGPVLWGGPVQPGAVFLTYSRLPEGVTSSEEDEETEPVFHIGPKLQVSPSREVIRAVSADDGNPGAFLSLGYAGWGAGQLDEEIQSGSWIFTEVDPIALFRVPADELYDHCIDTLGVAAHQLWMVPIDE